METQGSWCSFNLKGEQGGAASAALTLVTVLATFAVAGVGASPAQAQFRPRPAPRSAQRPRPQRIPGTVNRIPQRVPQNSAPVRTTVPSRVVVTPNNTLLPENDRQARVLLERMEKAEIECAFSAREITVQGNGGTVEQWVKRDPQRGFRAETLHPAGGILLDNGKRSWLLKPGASSWTEQDSILPRQRDPRALLQRRLGRNLHIVLAGQDTIGGRVADIVQITPAGGAATPSTRLWIDRETGLRLRTELYGPKGRLLRTSYYLEVDLNPRFNPTDFNPPTGVTVQRADRQHFARPDVAARAGYAVRPPRYLPAGFVAKGINVINHGERIVQVFSNGVTNISLVQTTKPLPRRVLRMLGSSETGFIPVGQQRAYTWRVGDTVFLVLGNLPDDELRRIGESAQ